VKPTLALIFWTLCTQAVPALDLPGLVPPPTASIDWGDQISNHEVGVLIEILEGRRWSAQAETLRELAPKVPVNTRFALYEKYKISGAWGLLNLYGVGSLIQGDPGTSLIAVGGLILGEASAITLSAPGAPSFFRDRPDGKILLSAGAVIGAGAYVYGLVRPWLYASEQNKKLRDLLFN